MSEREYSRLQVQLKPFFTLLVVVASSLFIASCGGGGESIPAAENSDSMKQALGVSGTTAIVPSGWVGRMPLRLSTPVEADFKATPSGVIADGWLVLYPKVSTSQQQVLQYINSKGYTLIGYGKYSNAYQIRLQKPGFDALQAAKLSAESIGYFDTVSFEFKTSINATYKPIDDDYTNPPYPWNHDAIKLMTAWGLLAEQRVALPNISIGIVDGGFSETSAYDLELDSLYEGSSVPGCRLFPNASDCDPHGYHVAGIIGAKGNNETGGVGVGAGLVDVSISAAGGSLSNTKAVEYIMYLLDVKSPKVINLSMGNGSLPNDMGVTAIPNYQAVRQAGIDGGNIILGAFKRRHTFRSAKGLDPSIKTLFIQAAGNSGTYFVENSDRSRSEVPAEDNGFFASMNPNDEYYRNNLADKIIVVGATDRSGLVAGYTQKAASNLRESYILAPGSEIKSNNRTGRLVLSGTSMAAPHVTGVAALVLQAYPDAPPKVVREIILGAANNNKDTSYNDHPQTGDGYDGYRYLNAAAAVKEAIRRKNIGTETLESAFTSNSTLSAPWSFGWQVSSGVAPIPYASFQPAGSRSDYPTFAIWNKVSGSAGSPPIDVYPWVVKNMGANPVLYSPLAAPFPAQSVIVTPGSSGEKAVFRWTAPVAGTYEINASYELMQGGEVDVHVQRNGIDIFSANIARQGSQAIVPAQRVTLSAGDTIDFVVGNGGNTQNSDITRVSASVKSAVGIGTIREKALWGNNGWTDSDTLPVCGVNWYRAGDGGTGKTLLQINHAEVPVSANRIFLNLYTRTWDNGGDASAEIYQVTQAWDPATVLWQTIPTTISAPSATFQLPANTPDNWVKVEITSLVKAWQGGTSNNGMLIDSKIDPWSYCRSFYSSNVEGKKPHVSWE